MGMIGTLTSQLEYPWFNLTMWSLHVIWMCVCLSVHVSLFLSVCAVMNWWSVNNVLGLPHKIWYYKFNQTNLTDPPPVGAKCLSILLLLLAVSLATPRRHHINNSREGCGEGEAALPCLLGVSAWCCYYSPWGRCLSNGQLLPPLMYLHVLIFPVKSWWNGTRCCCKSLFSTQPSNTRMQWQSCCFPHMFSCSRYHALLAHFYPVLSRAANKCLQPCQVGRVSGRGTVDQHFFFQSVFRGTGRMIISQECGWHCGRIFKNVGTLQDI